MSTNGGYCRACGLRTEVPRGVAVTKRRCRCGGELVTELTLARAAGIPFQRTFETRYLVPRAGRVP